MLTNIVDIFNSFVAGNRLIDGGQLAQLINLLFSVSKNLTASTTQTQAGALQLVNAINSVETASSNDAVRLPVGVIGLPIGIINNTANTIKVFGVAANPNIAGSPGDTIVAHDGHTPIATATGTTQATNVASIYYCFKFDLTNGGVWKQVNFA